MKSICATLAPVLTLLAVHGFAQTGARSLFSDHRSTQVGDIVTILVVEYASASSEAQTSTQKENDHGLVATGGAGTAAYSPMYGLNGTIRNGFRGDAAVTRQGRLQTKITATIKEVLPNGNLILEGSRTMEVNGEKELTTLTGTVRAQDVSWNNTVYSHQIADAMITYKGKGIVNSGQKPGFIARIFNWIF